MGSDVSKAVGEDYRGVGITSPEYLHTALIRETPPTFTEANPRPGVAQASAKSGMVLEVSGEMRAVDILQPELILTTNRGGNPGAKNGRFTWETNLPKPTDHETDFGWDSGNAISHVALVFGSGDTGTFGGCIRLQSNTVLWAVEIANDTYVFRKVFREVSYRVIGTTKWDPWEQGAIVVESAPKELPLDGTACFFQLPEGRVHLYVAVEDGTAPNRAVGQVTHLISDDDGASWTQMEKHILSRSIDRRGAGVAGYDIFRMRVAFNNDQALLLISGASRDGVTYPNVRNAFWQYASNDLGNSFTQIDISDPVVTVATGVDPEGALLSDVVGSIHLAAFHDMVAAADGSGFVVSYNKAASVAIQRGNVMVKRLGTAWTNWLSVVPLTVAAWTSLGVITDKVLDETNTSLAIDEDGVLALLYLGSPNSGVAETAGIAAMYFSTDHGVTWDNVTGSLNRESDPTDVPDPWWSSGDTSFSPANFCSTYQCGRLLVLTQFSLEDGGQGPVLEDKVFWELHLGGYTTATRTFKDAEEEVRGQGMWDKTWIPGQRFFDTNSWTFLGTGVELLNADGYTELITLGGQVTSVTNTDMGTMVSNELIVHGLCEFRARVGIIRFNVLISNGVFQLQMQIELDATNITVKDIFGVGDVYQESDIDPTDFVQFYWIISYTESRMDVWARASVDDLEARAWKHIVEFTQLGLAAHTTVSFTGFATPVNSNCDIKQVNWGAGPWGQPRFGGAQAFGRGYTATIFGRSWSPYPVHVHAGHGPRVAAVDGPSWDGDAWTITQRHEYALENIFPDVASSPRKTWRSRTYVGMNIPAQVWRVRVGLDADPAPWLGRVLFIAGFNANFPELEIAYRINSGAGWTALGTVVFSAGMQALKFIRDGKIVRPNTGAGPTSAAEHFSYNILAGSHFKFADTEIREISTNSEGVWTNQAGVRTRLYCPDIDGTELSSGVAGQIWMKDSVLIIRDCPDIYELRFTIPAGRTATGYYEMGTLPVGHIAYFGRQYARGRALSLVPNYNLTTARSGSRRAQALGPARRAVEFSWANENELDQTQLAASPPNPDYILPAVGSADPVASPADTALKMAGLIEFLRGPVEIMVYFSTIAMVTNENVDTRIVNRNLFMLARIMSDAQIEAILGSEGASVNGELVRMSKILAEEEV